MYYLWLRATKKQNIDMTKKQLNINKSIDIVLQFPHVGQHKFNDRIVINLNKLQNFKIHKIPLSCTAV